MTVTRFLFYDDCYKTKELAHSEHTLKVHHGLFLKFLAICYTLDRPSNLQMRLTQRE